jgi:fibronectin type 3 domain-containing protein
MKKLGSLLLVILTSLILSACGAGYTGSSGDSRGSTTGVVLSWAAPSSRTDGSYISPSELQGYRIYYGTTPDNLSLLVDLNDESITDYTINDLPAGSYYFAVTAYDADGVESAFSNVINKDV